MQAAHTTAPLLTVEDYRATPGGFRYQLVEGELYRMSPAPNRIHQIVVLNLAELLRRFLRQHPIGEVYVSPIDVFLSDHDVVQPDVLFVAQANLGLLADDGVHGAPDLVIEVLSPHTAALERTKQRVYARRGVKEYWLVDPVLQQIHVYHFTHDPIRASRVLGVEESVTCSLLPGLAIAVADVFRR